MTAPWQSILARFCRAAEIHGDRIALSEGEEVRYGELEGRVARLAAHLRSAGAGREVVVGICLPRS